MSNQALKSRKFECNLEQYIETLKEQEKSKNTILKYKRDIEKFFIYIENFKSEKDVKLEEIISKSNLIKWKEHLQTSYAPSSVNSMIAAINNYLDYIGKTSLKLHLIKIQPTTFADPNKELNKFDYQRLIKAAENNKNNLMSVIIQTIASTGIRVSELEYITIEGINKGQITIDNKGKSRKLLLPKDLIKLLKTYCKNQKILRGIIFRTKTGKPLDRSNIWKKMKKLCQKIGVKESKVFPHNLRKLFAKTFYQVKKDISKLADLLGHSNINTTRLYIMESGKEHIRQLDKMNLVYLREW